MDGISMNDKTDQIEKAEETPSVEEIFAMEKALSQRPKFSIRTRITLAFLLAFLFSFGIGISSMIYISILSKNQNFFDNAGKFAFEVDQARRNEKNFFLYGSKADLFTALKNIRSAESILQATASEMRSLVKQETFKRLLNDLHQYEQVMTEIAARYKGQGYGKKPDAPDAESQLRTSGHHILTFAAELVEQERAKGHEAVRLFMKAAIFLLVVNFIIMVLVAVELMRQILQPLGRTVQYTQRIAAGDFSLINPKRYFRDEFSHLAININRMIFKLLENQKQLVQNRKMVAVGTLTSGIAHELNNPLNNISLTTEAMLIDLDSYSRDEMTEMLKDIYTQVERASGTVRNLLDFTRLEPSKGVNINIEKLILSTLKLVNNERILNGVEEIVQIEENLPAVQGNFRNLQQVFLNIFLNAIQAMSHGGKLTVQAKKDGDSGIRVDITDNGCGIDKNDLERVFDPFFTTKDVGKGTGLGLSVSYGIVRKMGGDIRVASEPGKWTTFSVFLSASD
jgi:two-component system NtrC family sensor kinase